MHEEQINVVLGIPADPSVRAKQGIELNPESSYTIRLCEGCEGELYVGAKQLVVLERANFHLLCMDCSISRYGKESIADAVFVSMDNVDLEALQNNKEDILQQFEAVPDKYRLVEIAEEMYAAAELNPIQVNDLVDEVVAEDGCVTFKEDVVRVRGSKLPSSLKKVTRFLSFKDGPYYLQFTISPTREFCHLTVYHALRKTVDPLTLRMVLPLFFDMSKKRRVIDTPDHAYSAAQVITSDWTPSYKEYIQKSKERGEW